MIIAKEKQKKSNEKAFTNADLIKILEKLPKDALIMFQDYNFKSGKKEIVKDLIVRTESYPLNNNEGGESIILINQFLNLKKKK